MHDITTLVTDWSMRADGRSEPIVLLDINSSFPLCSNLMQPMFGASLHILKVEIGGDAQSTGRATLFLI